MTAYYNEFDPYAAQWLRSLIAAGHIAPGDVDERSIVDVRPDDLRGYSQCHFFAGIGGWSLALRLAGWDDARPVWTGSCPCQPFSAAGKRKGVKDERHLWPEFRRLIAECRPATVFGEQVASKDGRLWLAGVRADLEALGYAVGAADLCAAGVGAPHIRQRLWWVADAYGERSTRINPLLRAEAARRNAAALFEIAGSGAANGRMADADKGQCRRLTDGEGRQRDWQAAGWIEGDGESEPGGIAGGQGDARGQGLSQRVGDGGVRPEAMGTREGQTSIGTGAWSGSIFIPCADGKARRIEPGIQPLAHGVPARVGRLRAYGNAIVPQVSAEFIASYQDILEAA